MTPEAKDFSEECEQIHALLSDYGPEVFDRVTLFKNWTIGDIIGHLHAWNIAADLTLTDPNGFAEFIGIAMGSLGQGKSHPEFQKIYFAGQSDADIFADWAGYFPVMCERFQVAAPDTRVKWVGPDMSVRSCIIARQMEHWAHAQAIFDVLGVERKNADRLKNVAHIGVTTYSWSFKVRGETPPTPKPFVKLTAPSGQIWTWNEPQTDNRVEGSAESFCQIVTQCRNVADTDLNCIGETAKSWMANAQCFAGGAETPPAPGTRYKATS
ncbi:TIGR03084 family metal-binding protein [Litorimonas sp. WD9-15]|uniref:TIGR03084 family metal-binding protein n=1 Tax=Litorimonas sp. WD9-15 TaxID=3418716 RepID=UPI003D049246